MTLLPIAAARSAAPSVQSVHRGHARGFCNHALLVCKPELARAEYKLVRQTLAAHLPVFLEGVQYDESYAQHLAEARRVSRARTVAARLSGMLAQLGRPAPPKDEFALPPPPDSKLKAGLYAQEASRYEERGNTRRRVAASMLLLWRLACSRLRKQATARTENMAGPP